MQELLDLVYTPRSEWNEDVRSAFDRALKRRYPRIGDLTDRRGDEKRFQLRLNAMQTEESVPYAALIPPGQELSGPYGGMSFVLFPADEDGNPALISMVVGTTGLAPDETILGRPGHGRKCAAIASWLNSLESSGFAWSKRDPVRIDLDIPRMIDTRLDLWHKSREKYGKVMYSIFAPPTVRSTQGDRAVVQALTAFIDLFFDERRIDPKADARRDAEEIRAAWLARALPDTTAEDVARLLEQRRFVIIEGPPGTGKTSMARSILKDVYNENGRSIQFHPGTTYESFVGGLAPQEGGSMGFTFRPTLGHLAQAVLDARRDPNRRYLLLIDEINRADLSKVLGEAIYLFEPGQPDREIRLQHSYEMLGDVLSLPENLDVVGTMNSADRSIAMLDIAIRRRFAFVSLWPQPEVVKRASGKILQTAFEQLVTMFLEHATADSLPLLPGHAYFLGGDDVAETRLSTEVRPLLEEYLAQGYVAGFADEVRAFLDSLSQRV